MSVRSALLVADEADAPLHGPASFRLPMNWVGQTLRLAARDGITLRDPMTRYALGTDKAEDAQEGLDPAECMLLCMLLVNAVDDELHGVARSRMSRGTASMAAKASASSRTLEAAITTLCRFYDMIGGVCRFALHRDGADAVVTISTDRGDHRQRALVEELLAHTVHIQLSHFVGAFLPLTRFTTSSPLHPARNVLHPYLLCPTIEGSTSSLAFPVELLAAPSRGTPVEYPLWEASQFWLSRHPATRNPIRDDDPDRPATSALLSVLKQEDISIADCSTELQLGLQDLRRDLAAEGTSYREVRRTALLHRARPHLTTGCSVDDLADALGYSDSRSFRRALKLATGLSITELRRDAMALAPSHTALMTRLREEMLRLE